MMHPSNATTCRRWRRTGLAAALAALAGLGLGLTGCGGEEEAPEPVVRQPPPPPPPPKPAVVSVEDLKAQLAIDDRVMMSEDKAPDSTEERKVILQFFDAFARGDHRALKDMLSAVDQHELDRMIESGRWDRTVAGINMIEIQTGPHPDPTPGDEDTQCALAVFFVQGEFQPQLWYYRKTPLGAFEFDAAPCPPGIIDRLHGSDWITVWHEVLDEEMQIANRSDAEFEMPKRTLEDAERRGSGGNGGGPAVAPGGRRPIPQNPQAPPQPPSPGGGV